MSALRIAVATLPLLLGACQLAAPPTIRQADVNGVSLRYLDEGHGPTVVMVHGALLDHRSWELQRQPIAKHYRYVALDQRYFGPAEWPDDGSGFSFASQLADLEAFIRNLDTAPVHVVGWSNGASLGLALAARHPELVRSLFVYEPALPSVVTRVDEQKVIGAEMQSLAPVFDASRANDQEKAVGLFAEWVNNGEAAPASVSMPDWFQAILKDNARALALALRDPPGGPITCADLQRIRVPVAIAKGAQTRPFFSVLTAAAGRCVPRARLVTIPAATHAAPVQNPQAFNAALLAFLKASDR